MNKMAHPRPLDEREQRLLAILTARIFPPYRHSNFRHCGLVLPLDDGGMGSLRFVCPDAAAEETGGILPVAEYQADDSDGIPVLATLYALSDGSLYEIGIWKADFQAVRDFPP